MEYFLAGSPPSNVFRVCVYVFRGHAQVVVNCHLALTSLGVEEQGDELDVPKVRKPASERVLDALALQVASEGTSPGLLPRR